MKNLEIVPFQKKYKADFERLNREWIEEYFQMEEEDFYTLQNPESHVIEKNGLTLLWLYLEIINGVQKKETLLYGMIITLLVQSLIQN